MEWILRVDDTDASTQATYIFLDQPIGTGFSSGDVQISKTDDAKDDVLQFLDEFFHHDFSSSGKPINFANNDFHIAGESYAGHYIPSIAAAILKRNKSNNPKDPNSPRKINLKSVMVGNPAVDKATENQVAFDYVCDPNKTPNREYLIEDGRLCRTFEADLETCLDQIKDCRNDASKCRDASVTCGRFAQPALYAGAKGRDVYDLSNALQRGQARNPVEGLNGNGYLAQYVNQATTTLGAKLPVDAQWRMCDSSIVDRFTLSGDLYADFTSYYNEMLSYANIRVLVYAVRYPLHPRRLTHSSHISCYWLTKGRGILI